MDLCSGVKRRRDHRVRIKNFINPILLNIENTGAICFGIFAWGERKCKMHAGSRLQVWECNVKMRKKEGKWENGW